MAPSTWRPPWLETMTPATPVVHGPPRVVGAQDPFQEDGEPGDLPQSGQVVPGPRGIGEDFAEVLEGARPGAPSGSPPIASRNTGSLK